MKLAQKTPQVEGQCCNLGLRDKELHTALGWIDRKSTMAPTEDLEVVVDDSLIEKLAPRRVDLGDLTGAAWLVVVS